MASAQSAIATFVPQHLFGSAMSARLVITKTSALYAVERYGIPNMGSEIRLCSRRILFRAYRTPSIASNVLDLRKIVMGVPRSST